MPALGVGRWAIIQIFSTVENARTREIPVHACARTKVILVLQITVWGGT